MHPIILVLIFIVATVVGYLLIKNVPSLLHTPLMSGMNALPGITVRFSDYLPRRNAECRKKSPRKPLPCP